MIAAVCGVVALTADPWGRPDHLRAVAEPPAAWGDLDRPRARARLYWDDTGVPAEVQVQRAGGWRTVTTTARPGWTSRPVPPGAAFRVRVGGAGRWSAPVSAPAWTSPADLARMASGGPGVYARTVGDLDRDPSTGHTWASTLGGGAVELSGAGGVRRAWGAWEGLPHDRVVAVSAADGTALVGTARGAALIACDRVVRVWDDALPSPYVQAVEQEGGRLWVGTYRGLARLDAAVPVPVLAPWSVFSLSAADGGGVWAGYEGLRHVAPDAPAAEVPDDPPRDPSPHLPAQRVYDSVDLGAGRVLAASLDEGVWLVDPAAPGAAERLPAYPPSDTTAVAPTADGLWVAAGTAGLFGPGGEPVGAGHGLPVGAAWSVSADPAGQLTVGTDRGLWQLRATVAAERGPDGRSPLLVRAVAPVRSSPWPADLRADALWVGRDGALVGGPEGVRAVGQPVRGAGDLMVGARRDVVALVEDDDGIWAVGRRAVHLDRRGRLDQVPLPERPRDADTWAGHLWLAAPGGLWRVDGATRQVALAVPLPEATRVAAGPRSLWVLSRGVVFQVLGGVAHPYMRTGRAVSMAPVDGAVWVGTEDGLERIVLGGDDPGAVQDVLGDRDRGVEIVAVADDGAGGAWFAGVDGSVGRARPDGAGAALHLPGPEPARPTRVVPDGPEHAWVLTRAGTWRVHLPPPEIDPPPGDPKASPDE